MLSSFNSLLLSGLELTHYIFFSAHSKRPQHPCFTYQILKLIIFYMLLNNERNLGHFKSCSSLPYLYARVVIFSLFRFYQLKIANYSVAA